MRSSLPPLPKCAAHTRPKVPLSLSLSLSVGREKKEGRRGPFGATTVYFQSREGGESNSGAKVQYVTVELLSLSFNLFLFDVKKKLLCLLNSDWLAGEASSSFRVWWKIFLFWKKKRVWSQLFLVSFTDEKREGGMVERWNGYKKVLIFCYSYVEILTLYHGRNFLGGEGKENCAIIASGSTCWGNLISFVICQ